MIFSDSSSPTHRVRSQSRTIRSFLAAVLFALIAAPANGDFVIEVDDATIVAGQTQTVNAFIRGDVAADDLNFFVFDLVLEPLAPLTLPDDDGVSFVDPGDMTEPFANSTSYIFSGNSEAADFDDPVTTVDSTEYPNDTLGAFDFTLDGENETVGTAPELLVQFQIQTALDAAPGVYEISVLDPEVDDAEFSFPAVTGVSGFITVTAVPEPSSMLALSAVGGAMVWLRKRKRQPLTA